MVGAVAPVDGPVAREVCERVCAGCCGVPVAESAVAPPGSIPNPVVTHGSAGEYCRGDAVGGEAAAGAPQDPGHHHTPGAGWSSGSSLGS